MPCVVGHSGYIYLPNFKPGRDHIIFYCVQTSSLFPHFHSAGAGTAQTDTHMRTRTGHMLT